MTTNADRRVVLLKGEDTYATDATPGGANALMAFNVSGNPFVARYATRRPIAPYFRAEEQVPAAVHQTFAFGIEAAGSGAAGTAPGYADALKACGLAETITAGTSAAYAPASAGPFDSCTIYDFIDGERRRGLGARGAVRFEAQNGGIPMFIFAIMGLYSARSAVALPTPDWSAFRDGLPINKENTPTFSILGFDAKLRSLTIDLAQRVVHHNMTGLDEIRLTGRSPSGSVSIEAPAVGTKDFVAAAKAGTTGTLQLVHGTAAGATFQADCAKVKLTNVRDAEQDGILFLEADLNVLPSDGDDEVTFTIK